MSFEAKGYAGRVQTVFMIDLPRLSEAQRAAPPELTFFGKELLNFMEAMGLQKDAIAGVQKFDYSGTKHLAFVHTM